MARKRNTTTVTISAPQGGVARNATAGRSRNARRRANRRRRSAANARILNPYGRSLGNAGNRFGPGMSEDEASFRYKLAKRNPFNSHATGAKVIDFDHNYSSTVRAELERFFPSSAATFCSGYIQPTTAGGATATATWITTDGASTTSSDTVIDFSKITVATWDEANSGQLASSIISERRLVGGGVLFEYRGASGSASGELVVAPVTQNNFQNNIYNSASEMSVSILKKIPGAIIVPLSQLQVSAAVFRFANIDPSSLNYVASGTLGTGWTGCLYAVAGGPSAVNYLKVTALGHYEVVHRGGNVSLDDPPARPNPRTLADEQAFDAEVDSYTGILPFDVINTAMDYLGQGASSVGEGIGRGLLNAFLGVGSSPLDLQMARLALAR